MSSAQVYKWVDAEGNTKFSQFPPEDVNIKSEELAVTSQHSRSVEISEEQLFGTWSCKSSDGNTFKITFTENHTMSMILKGKNDGMMSGTWSLQGSKLNNTLSGYLEKNNQRKYIQGVSGYEIFTSVSETSLRSIDSAGNTTEYKKL